MGLGQTNPHYLDSLGWAYYKLKQLDKAELYLTQAVQQDTKENLSEVYEHLGDVYKDNGKIEPAKAAWQKALSLATEAEEISRIKAKLAGDNKK